MRNNSVELPAPLSIKVHVRMCSDLQNLVETVSEIIPVIEAARPRASGMEALCLLNEGITKAKSLLQHCSESSVLYLVLTGDAILVRLKKVRNLMEYNLSQIQNRVPMVLAAKISTIILAVKSAAFCLDPLEQEAANVLRDLVNSYGVDLAKESALSATHAVCSWLQISSQEALAIEKGSIARLIKRFGENRRKKVVLMFFLRLLNQYTDPANKAIFEYPPSLSSKVELQTKCRDDEVETDLLSRPVPPKEFLCPLSARLMLDPVIIASGQTYERMWIQKWFDEGHDICPKTNEKLDRLSFISNFAMKDIISKWCDAHHFSGLDAKKQDMLVKSWEMSVSSTRSLAACIDNLNFH